MVIVEERKGIPFSCSHRRKTNGFINYNFIELTFVSSGRPRRLKRFLFLSFFLVLMMSSSLIFAFSRALIRSSLAVDWRWLTWVRNSDSASPPPPS